MYTYLSKCKSNPQPPGFADFLRGTIELYNYSKLYNYKLYINCDHPLFNFLNPNKNLIINKTDINYEKEVIELLPPLSYTKIDYNLNALFISGNSFNVMTNAFYTRNNNLLMNFGKISDELIL